MIAFWTLILSVFILLKKGLILICYKSKLMSTRDQSVDLPFLLELTASVSFMFF